MILYEMKIPPHVARAIRKLAPDIKKKVKEALKDLAKNPHLGEPLRKELTGLWKYRARRYRIVYKPVPQKKQLQIYAVGHRRDVYEKLRLSD